MITIRIDITEMAGATSAKCIATDVDATDMEKKLLESIVDSLGLPKNIVHHCAKDLADKYRISANKPPL